jgi:hypothetical protein
MMLVADSACGRRGRVNSIFGKGGAMDRGWRNLTLAIAPSGGLCWGLASWRVGPGIGLIGVLGGAAVGVLGGWLLARQADRASAPGGSGPWVPAGLTLVLLFLALVVVPSVLWAGMARGLPPVW